MSQEFSGNKVALGAAVYIFFSVGFLSIYVAGFALIPDTYGVPLSAVSTAVGISPIIGFLSSMAYTTMTSRIHVRGMMYLTPVIIVLAALSFKFLNGFIALAIAFALIGAINSTGAFPVVTELISNWFVEKRSDKIAVALGASTFGMAAIQFIGGQVFSALGYRDGYALLGLACACILTLITKFMIVANTPEEVGQVALGQVEEASQDGVAQIEGEASSLYRNPSFWLCCVARFIGAGGVMFVSTYATLYFGGAGIDLATAATIVSIMTLLGGLFSTFMGRLLEMFGAKGLLGFVLAAAALCNVAMIAYGVAPSAFMLVAVVALFAVGNTYSTVTNLIVDRMFSPADANNANSKLLGVLLAGNIVWLPVSGFIIEGAGYTALYGLIATLNAASLVLFLAALRISERMRSSEAQPGAADAATAR